VDAHVGLQVSLFCELLAAAMVWTYEGLQTSVSSHVNFQSASPGIALATDIALERLFTGVNQLVSL
jgi:hypothetical protein